MKLDTTIKRMRLKQQLHAEPTKLLALVEQLLVQAAIVSSVMWGAHRFGITDTFKSDVIVGGIIGALFGYTYILFSDGAPSEWTVPGQVNPDAVRNALLTLKYSEKQPGVYQPKRPLFSLFHRYKSERITLHTVGADTLFSGPYKQLKKLSTFTLVDTQSPVSDHTPPTVQG